MDTRSLKEVVTEAIRYWEPRRLAYNAVLAAVVICCFALAYPQSKAQLSFATAQIVFILAVLANVVYCAAYAADIFAQMSGYREIWQRYRWILFVVGLVFAGVITRFWAIGLFGD